MPLRIFNTLTRLKEEFRPLQEGKVTMYVCGPTVWNLIHIGNARPFLFFDVVRRYLRYKGYEVRYVQNFTDVDDKLIAKARELGITVPQVAQRFIAAYFEDAARLGVEPADAHPCVTDHMANVVTLISRLLEKGCAYEVNGNVYFRVRSFPAYGRLSHQPIEELRSGSRVEVEEEKEDPLDFVLWKRAKEGEIAWPSPWGEGRPGWHIECSAMSMSYLGECIDIHAGGHDLIFPHHENEIAQSESVTEKPFVRYWMHNGHLTIRDEKMSKSLGNVLTVRDVTQRVRPEVFRFFMLSTYYRNPIHFSEELLDQAKAGLERIETAVDNLSFLLSRLEAAAVSPPVAGDVGDGQLCQALERLSQSFDAAMDDDFNTANALSVVFDAVREANRYMADPVHATPEGVRSLLRLFRKWDQTLGLLGVDAGSGGDEDRALTADQVRDWIERREEARRQRNWPEADRIRDRLLEQGIAVEDTPQGPRWKLVTK